LLAYELTLARKLFDHDHVQGDAGHAGQQGGGQEKILGEGKVYISDHKTENFFENGQQFYTKF
jgi:hypothetical protein